MSKITSKRQTLKSLRSKTEIPALKESIYQLIYIKYIAPAT